MLWLKPVTQQDEAPAHYSRKVRYYLNQVFLDRRIGPGVLWNGVLVHLTNPM